MIYQLDKPGQSDYTQEINATRDMTWKVINDIASWPRIFENEYQEAKILERDITEDECERLIIALTPLSERGEISYTWISERILDHKNYRVYAHRITPGPFLYMNIYQEVLLNKKGCILRWVQNYRVKPDQKFTTEQAQEHMDSVIPGQLLAHASYIEKMNR